MSKVQDNKENVDKCKCPTCPSYTECLKQKTAVLFCARGKAECPITMKGCVCGVCPVHTANNLKSGYYCLQGSADEIEK